MCKEEPDLRFGDETYKVVVNTKGSRGEISSELKEILTYLDNETVTGEFSKELNDAVNAVKSSEERRLEYMRLKLRDNEILAKGRAEGHAEGRAEGQKEGRSEGMILTIWDLLQKNIITLPQAAAQAGMSEKEFVEKAKSYIHL